MRDTLRNLRNDLSPFRSDADNGPVRRTFGFTERQVERVVHLASRGIDERFDRGENPQRITRQVLSDGTSVVRLADHFSRLENVAGEPVRRAYEAVMNFVLREGETESNRLRIVTDLLRDLRTGAFLNPRDMEAPFPLTGRARVVSEMMALMRTVEAVERFAAELRANPNRIFNGDLAALTLTNLRGGIISAEFREIFLQALANPGPTFPGLAGLLEIPRLIAALDGVLLDAAGRPLLQVDGTPLKLGELLWFNPRAEAALDLWAQDRFPTRLSPLLVHGFDAVYSVIGFDGRPLTLPRFMAIQSQMNASEFEWLFGHAPLSEGWLRAAIEFLKDSISIDHNVLGELLEEAVTTGRFHLTVMSGTVEEGKPVDGSFSFSAVHDWAPPAFSSAAR